jgi:hypothetical protein
MKTITDESLKKFSSGLALAILAFSGFLFVLPAIPTANAVQASPTITVSGVPLKGNTIGQIVSIDVTNPASNPYPIVSLSVSAPSGWTVDGCGVAAVSLGLVNSCTSSSSGAFFTGNLPPGQSWFLVLNLTTPSGTYPFTGTFTTSVQDASSAAYYPGPTFSIQVMDPNTAVTVTVTPGGSNTPTLYTAGTAPYTITAKVTPAQAGLPIVWSASYPPNTVYSFTPSTSTTDSSGKATTTFQPSNHALDSAQVTATVGTSTVSSPPTAFITTQAGAPSKVIFSLSSAPFPSTDYVTTSGTPSSSNSLSATIALNSIYVSAADSFGNTVSFSDISGVAITVSALSGGGFFDAGGGNHPTTISCTTGGVDCATGTITLPYFQSSTYGTIGMLSATITGTYQSSPVSLSGSSGSIFTSTFASSATQPTVSATSVPAGGTVLVRSTTSPPQAGVPVTFYLAASSTLKNKDGHFVANGLKQITVTTASNGTASAKFAVDTGAGASESFFANYARPTNTNPTGTTGNSTSASPAVLTTSGPASQFIIKTYFDTGLTEPSPFVTPSGTLYVNVAIADAYGNTVTVSPPSPQVQITLSASSGLLSATTVYISSGKSDTNSSFGTIQFTAPSSTGSVTLSASGVYNGNSISSTATVTVVSPTPSLFVNSPKPLNGVIYANSSPVVFSGNASVSKGYPPSTNITSVKYKLGSGASGSVILSPANSLTWSVAVPMPSGLNSITFNATDSNGNTVTSQTFTVLVDSSPPTLKFTTPNGASLQYGQSVNAWIVDTLGDLNFTSVSVTRNGTAIPSSSISISPSSNTLGTSINYTVTISNLPAGKWVLQLSAKDLAGNNATPVSITVTVSVPFAQSVVSSGTPSYGTLGGFNGVSASFTNLWTTSQNLVVFAVWKNSAGQTVAVTTAGLTLAPGQTASAFAPLTSPLPSGTYTVNIFVITTSNQPVSTTTTITVTI